jgi:hypothetical protein
MKIKFIIISFCLVLLFCSCESKTNLAYQRKVEKEKIAQYFKDNSIKVIEVSKEEQENLSLNVSPPDVFYHLGEDSIYFRLDKTGTGDSIKTADRMQIRYVRSTMDNPPIVESYWTTVDLPYPLEVIYGDKNYTTNQNCAGWQSAVRLMKYSDAECQIIVPSVVGMYHDYNLVTPYHYKFTFKILPK